MSAILHAQPAAAVSVRELVDRFLEYARGHYRTETGVSQHVENLVLAVRETLSLFGDSQAVAFGPLALRQVREAMIKAGLCRKVINARIDRVRQVIRWGVSMELLPAVNIHALECLPGIRPGQFGVKDRPPIKPVLVERVEATIPHMPRLVATMVKLQLLTGMRSGEVRVMRTVDIDTSGPVWFYRPPRHKGTWREKDRVIYIGPQAQEVLQPFLKPDDPGAYLFRSSRTKKRGRGTVDPARHLLKLAADNPGDFYIRSSRAARLTGISVHVLSRLAHKSGKVRGRRPLAAEVRVYLKQFPDRACLSLQWWDPVTKRMKTQTTNTSNREKGEELRSFLESAINAGGDDREQMMRLEVHVGDLIEYVRGLARAGQSPYRAHSYSKAINRACKRAGVSPWTPLQLRHTAATNIRRHYGLEAAQVILGHSRADVTQIYAERDMAKAEQIIAAIG
jgi:integrase